MWWLLVFVPAALALNYRCQNNQVLVVQSFGNDTIRMHCQRLDMCGYQRLRCDYDEFQPQCGGLMNFVAHVVQTSATSPSVHLLRFPLFLLHFHWDRQLISFSATVSLIAHW
ncbi:hypothetical protein ANCCAN_07089 [Ancylostoma caninum]|uniref:Uncharacterized protein n=1 Tax=Ancylostoma caninum TaxID=29170 RepID=A0A368GV70_ANCCA|nr:hypothetical protein ANCCAN_07089 [Ancylostoma caninum]